MSSHTPVFRYVLLGLLVMSLFTLFVAQMAVPNVVGAGQRAAQAAAVSRLRTLLWAQDRFRELALADRNGDGQGEFGLLTQLTGRGAAPGGRLLDTMLLEPVLGQLTPGARGGVAVVAGYCYQVYLPAADGQGVTEGAVGGEPAGRVDAAGAARTWVAYAWPSQRNRSGRKVFYINQDEEIWESPGTAPGQAYDGPDHAPAWDAALSRRDLRLPPLDNQPGGDGGRWVRWKGKQPRGKAASP